MPYREWSLRIQDIIGAIALIQQCTTGITFEDFTATEEIIRPLVPLLQELLERELRAD